MDLYGLAGELLTVMGGQLSAAGVTLPTQQFVGAGPLPVWDFDQFAVHLVRVFTGMPGAETPVQPSGFTTRSAEFAVSIVRTVPIPNDYGIPPSADKMTPYIVANMGDVAALQAGAEQVKAQALWVPYATPFAIGACTTQGPEGGMLAAVLSLQIQVLS